MMAADSNTVNKAVECLELVQALLGIKVAIYRSNCVKTTPQH